MGWRGKGGGERGFATPEEGEVRVTNKKRKNVKPYREGRRAAKNGVRKKKRREHRRPREEGGRRALTHSRRIRICQKVDLTKKKEISSLRC